jgi:hypothetical protein
LDAVSARLIEGLTCSDIIFDFSPVQNSKGNASHLKRFGHDTVWGADQTKSSEDLMRAAGELSKHLARLSSADGLIQDFALDRDHRVRAEDEIVERLGRRDAQRFFARHTCCEGLGAFPRPHGLLDAAFHDFELKTGGFEQLPAARGTRGQDQAHRGTNYKNFELKRPKSIRAGGGVINSGAFPIQCIGRRISLEEIGKILPRVFERRAAKQDAGLTEFLALLWEQVAGPAIAAESRPQGFAGGTLTLAVSSAAWAVALKKMSEELRAAVNGYLGRAAVRKLRIVVPSRTTNPEAGPPSSASYEVRDETVSRLERTLARYSIFPKG